VILSSVFVEESNTRADLLMLSVATLAYTGGWKWKLCEVSVASALFIEAAYDYNSVISNSMSCPFLGDVSGSFVMA
jgi:hypothetical protein